MCNVHVIIIYYNYNHCRFGPPVRFWCVRYESKHNYFKQLAHRVKCFKNISKILAQRHQEFMCYNLNAENGLFKKQALVGPGMYHCA